MEKVGRIRTRLASSWGTLLAARLLSAVLAVLALALAGRNLDSDELGTLLLHLASFGFTSFLASAGIQPVVLRELAGSRSPSSVLTEAFRRAELRALGAGLGFLLVLLAFGHWNDAWLLACVPAHLLLSFQVAAAPSLLLGRTRPLARSELLGRVLCLLLLWPLLAQGSGGAALFAWILGQGLGHLSLLADLDGSTRRAFLPSVPDPGKQKLNLAESLTGLGDLCRAMYLHGSQWILAAYVGPAYGNFGAPLRLLGLCGVVPGTLATSLQGPLSRGELRDRRRRVLDALPFVLGLGVLSGLVLAVPARNWLSLLFPRIPELDAAVRCLRILSGACPAFFAAGLLLPLLLARREELGVLRVSVTGLLTLLSILVAGSPKLEAAAFGLLACEWVVFLGALRAVLRLEASEPRVAVSEFARNDLMNHAG